VEFPDANYLKLYPNFFNLQSGIELPVTTLTAIALATFHFKDQNLLTFPLVENLAYHRCSWHPGLADLEGIATRDHQYLFQSNIIAELTGKFLYPDDVPRGDAILLATGLNDCVHIFLLNLIN